MKESYDSSSYPVFVPFRNIGKDRVMQGYFSQSVDQVLTKLGTGATDGLNDPLCYVANCFIHQCPADFKLLQ